MAEEPVQRRLAAILFADVVGYSRLTGIDEEGTIARLKKLHSELFEPLVEGHRGRIVRLIGDGALVEFASAVDAVRCAVETQRGVNERNVALPSNQRIEFRIGINLGDIVIDGDDIVGDGVNVAARLEGIAAPGSVCISAKVYEEVGNKLSLDFIDLGEQSLKNIADPVKVFQIALDRTTGIGTTSLDAIFRRPAVAVLPLQLTRFVGREREIGEVRSTLRASRLVTLTGTGGSGKTRLALQVASDLLEQHPDGTWFVELAGTMDPALVPRLVSSTIGIREQQGRPILDTLIHHLDTKATLLVLDNCEHLLDACAELAERLLRACDGLSVIATSREPLGITGESICRVPPLSVPEADLAASAEAVASFEAVQLFVDRAVAVAPHFSLSDANAVAVVAVCRRLEGIPLSLELAAARLQALTVEQIRDRLADRFRLLTRGSRTALPRQQTLRATVDWSHDLLSAPERVLLRRLSVFAGGFSLDAVEQVCGGGQIAPEDVLDLLTRLVGRSLVLFETVSAGGRYGFLETIRAYALEKLCEEGEELDFRRHHLTYCIGIAETAEPALLGPDQQSWLDRLQTELENFRAAFAWSVRQIDPGPTLRLASALREFWVVRADWSEGLDWVEQALDLPGEVDPTFRMKALRAAAELADVLSDYPRATARYEECLEIARALGDKRSIGTVLSGLAHEADRVGRIAEARALIEESVALLREMGDEPSLARSLGGLARLTGNYAEARALENQILDLRRRSGNPENVGWALLAVGQAAQGEGDYAAAQTAYEELLSIGRDLGYKRMIARSLTQLAEVALLEGKTAEARGLLEKGLPIWEEIGHKSGLLDTFRGLGDVARQEGDLQGAEPFLQQSLEICRASGNLEGEARALQSLGAVAMSRGDLDGAESLHSEALALLHRMEHLDGMAASLRTLGTVATEERLNRAARLLGASEALREQAGGVVPLWDRAALDRAVERLRSGLGAESFQREWESGRQFTVAEAVGLSLETTPASAEDGGAQEEAPEGPLA